MSREGRTPGLRLALAGGGTGGHVVPGLHVLAACGEGALADLLWLVAGRAVEDRVLAGLDRLLGETPHARVRLALEPAGGGAPRRSALLVRLGPAVLAARRALRAHRSEVLLGLGGYTTVPAVLAARMLGIPVALLEINAVPGRATRHLARLAQRVFHAWPATVPPGDARAALVGPPLPPALAAAVAGDPGEARRRLGFRPEEPLLLVLGGSQGALGLNRFVARAAPGWCAGGLQVLHQVGPGRSEEAAGADPRYRAVEYVDDVPLALAAATVVLCRGGASTLAEVGAARRPAWVVPYPHHADRHQERNAAVLGAGVRVVPEASLDAEAGDALLRLASPAGAGERAAMERVLAGCVPLDAAARIVHALEDLARGERAAGGTA